KSILYSVECKSGESNILFIPMDQIERAKDITDNFLSIYQKRFIVFAFKFKGTAKRKLQYRFMLMMSPFMISSTLRGVSYNITTDKLTFHQTDSVENIIPIPIQSIWGFVNFL